MLLVSFTIAIPTAYRIFPHAHEDTRTQPLVYKLIYVIASEHFERSTDYAPAQSP